MLFCFSKGTSDSTVETVRGINDKSEMTKKLEEIKVGLNSQILTADSANPKQVIPELQGSIGALEKGINARLDLQSAGLHRNTEGTLTCKNTLK